MVTGAGRGRSVSAASTISSTAAGRGSKRAAVRAVWRTSAVSEAAATPLPVTSPSRTMCPPATGKTS